MVCNQGPRPTIAREAEPDQLCVPAGGVVVCFAVCASCFTL